MDQVYHCFTLKRFNRLTFRKSVNPVLFDVILCDIISGYFLWKTLHTPNCPEEVAELDWGHSSTLLTFHLLIETVVSRIISLRLCYFRWLFSVTAMKSWTMKVRAAAVCDTLCCTWQPNSEAGQAKKKCCWIVGRGFGVTAYLRDLLWCHLWGFMEESPDSLILDIVRAKCDTLEICSLINVVMRKKNRKKWPSNKENVTINLIPVCAISSQKGYFIKPPIFK